jgi:MYXO-CTERM domain-containing protein
MPSPQVVGFVGGMTLLLLGAAFVTRGRRPISPA